MTHLRFAIYHLPSDATLATFGARWLGWNVVRGKPSKPFDIPGLSAVVDRPRKYGFHATLKPPFRLADSVTPDTLHANCKALASRTAPAQAEALKLTRLGRFLALTFAGDATEIDRVAAACVTELDIFRAPASDAELAIRRGTGLRPRQEKMLSRWGYPHVLEEFRFHMTLTGRVAKDDLQGWEEHVRQHLPPLQTPFVLDTISLCGERPDGLFEEIQRFPLTGHA